MNALAQIEDTREPRAIQGVVVGYCTDCGQDVLEGDYRIEFQHDYLCSSCASKMNLVELAAWFGGEYKRG